MRHRVSSEGWDERIVVIAAKREDQKESGKSVSDSTLKDVLDKLVTYYKPATIGLDIYRDQPQARSGFESKSASEHTALADYMKSNSVIAICRSKEGKEYTGVQPPPGYHSEDPLLGFNDVANDAESNQPFFVRRHLLHMPFDSRSPCKTRFAFNFQVAAQYLASNRIGKESYQLIWNEKANNFLFFNNRDQTKKVEFIPLGFTFWENLVSSAGYQKPGQDNYDPAPYQVMLNYRTGSPQILSFNEIISKSVEVSRLQNKIVLIGYLDVDLNRSEKDIVKTPVDSEVAGVVLQAHMVSQIISAVLDGRKLIWYWNLEWEILWIGTWSLVAGRLVWHRSWIYSVLVAVGLSVVLFITCYLFFLAAGWVPFIPAFLAILSSIGLIKTINWQKITLKKLLNSLIHLLQSSPE